MLQSNVDALAQVRPDLLARLQAPSPRSRVTVSDGVSWRPFRNPMRLEDPVLGPVSGPLLMLGAGEGSALHQALDQTEVVLWEPDLDLWRALLSRHDLAGPLASGRLVPCVGVDLAALGWTGAVWEHPQLGHYRPWARGLLDAGRPLALMFAGELFVDDVVEALQHSGWRVFVWDAVHLSERENQHVLRCGAKACFAINTQPGLVEAAEAVRMPVVLWEIDPTTDGPARLSRNSRGAYAFTYRKAQVRPLSRAGYTAEYLPLAANARRLASPRPRPEGTLDIGFVGASLVPSSQRCKAQLAQLAPAGTAIRHALDRTLDLQRTLTDWQVPQLLEQLAPGLRERVRRQAGGLDIAVLLREAHAAEKRLTWVANLGQLGVEVWGDPGWQLIAPHGVRYRGWADHFRDVPALYQHVKVQVDIGRLYQSDIVTMRVFDVLAAGGFLITEPGEALSAFFTPGVELETAASPEELVDKCRYYLAHPEARTRIARAGQARVRTDHTIEARVQRMLARTHLGVAELA